MLAFAIAGGVGPGYGQDVLYRFSSGATTERAYGGGLDVNRDGFSDLIIGQPWVQSIKGGKLHTGGFQVVSGRDLSVLHEFWHVPWPVTTGYGSGAQLVPDLNRDGHADFLVAEGLRANGGIGKVIGAVHVYSGKTGKILRTHVGTGDTGFGGLGSVGDLDKDGVPDVGISAIGNVTVYSAVSGKLLGQARGSGGFGSCFVHVGDANGDGVADFLVGAPYDVPSGQEAAVGSISLVSGKTLKAIYKVWGSIKGVLPSGNYGTKVVTLGDIDGDKVTDFVTGDRGIKPGTGFVQVHSGKTGKALYTIFGPNPADGFGASVETVPDMDGDGVREVLVTAYPDSLVKKPFFELRSGKTGRLLRSITTPAGTDMRVPPVGVGDLDGDGTEELAVQVHSQNEPRNVWVYTMRDLSLNADVHAVSAAKGGKQVLSLEAPSRLAGQQYWVLSSASGTRPGIPLSAIALPLNYDVLTEFTISSANGKLMPKSRGQLDSSGRATVSLVVPGNLGALKGLTVHHAFIVSDKRGNIAFGSNAKLLRLD